MAASVRQTDEAVDQWLTRLNRKQQDACTQMRHLADAARHHDSEREQLARRLRELGATEAAVKHQNHALKEDIACGGVRKREHDTLVRERDKLAAVLRMMDANFTRLDQRRTEMSTEMQEFPGREERLQLERRDMEREAEVYTQQLRAQLAKLKRDIDAQRVATVEAEAGAKRVQQELIACTEQVKQQQEENSGFEQAMTADIGRFREQLSALQQRRATLEHRRTAELERQVASAKETLLTVADEERREAERLAAKWKVVMEVMVKCMDRDVQAMRAAKVKPKKLSNKSGKADILMAKIHRDILGALMPQVDQHFAQERRVEADLLQQVLAEQHAAEGQLKILENGFNQIKQQYPDMDERVALSDEISTYRSALQNFRSEHSITDSLLITDLEKSVADIRSQLREVDMQLLQYDPESRNSGGFDGGYGDGSSSGVDGGGLSGSGGIAGSGSGSGDGLGSLSGGASGSGGGGSGRERGRSVRSGSKHGSSSTGGGSGSGSDTGGSSSRATSAMKSGGVAGGGGVDFADPKDASSGSASSGAGASRTGSSGSAAQSRGSPASGSGARSIRFGDASDMSSSSAAQDRTRSGSGANQPTRGGSALSPSNSSSPSSTSGGRVRSPLMGNSGNSGPGGSSGGSFSTGTGGGGNQGGGSGSRSGSVTLAQGGIVSGGDRSKSTGKRSGSTTVNSPGGGRPGAAGTLSPGSSGGSREDRKKVTFG